MFRITDYFRIGTRCPGSEDEDKYQDNEQDLESKDRHILILET